jgi:CHAT domain-containing protein
VGPYLIEAGPVVHHLSAERDLAPARGEPRGRGLLVLGNPSFDGPVSPPAVPPAPRAVPGPGIRFRGTADACASFRDLEFEALPASGEEADTIAGVWRAEQAVAGGDSGAVLSLRGEAASEANLKREAPGRRVIHLAPHGFFLGDDCPDPEGVERSSPLLRSGLALAGANRREAAGADGEDGILTAEEIAALDLSSVEWAVLSACDTGLGTVRAGEGVLGLRRAFQVAGADTVVMSLWAVDDQTTRRFMTDLYRKRFEAGLPTATALHEAALGILRERRGDGETAHPFFWAPFVAAGAWQ